MSSCPTQILSLRRKRTCLHNHRSIYIYIHIYICIRVSRFQTSRETPVPEHPHCVTTFRIVFTHTVVVSFSHDYNYCPPFDHLYPLVEKKQWQREREREKGVKKLFPLERTTFTRIVHRDPDDRVASRLPRNEFFPGQWSEKLAVCTPFSSAVCLLLDRGGRWFAGWRGWREGGRENRFSWQTGRLTARDPGHSPRFYKQPNTLVSPPPFSSAASIFFPLFKNPPFQKVGIFRGK